MIFNTSINYLYQMKYSGKAIIFAKGLNFDFQEIGTHGFMPCYKYFSVYSK